MNDNEYALRQRALASAWKQRTPDLPEEARGPAPWINHEGQPRGRYDHCLPPEFAQANLLSSREAIDLFKTLHIKWHCGIGSGPGNNLLSSQVQCVNALLPMVHEPQRIIRGLGNLLDIAEPLEIEPGRYLTFEYIGPHDYFNEGAGQPRERGSKCTSVDAAFTYRTRHGTTELGLVEWKYTEQYMATREPNPGYDKTRVKRYGDTYHAPDGPLRSDLMDVDWMLDEPFYQLMRQQLLAWRLEQDRAEGADVVRVLHVLPPENHAYQNSLVRPQQRALGDTVDQVWARLLRRADRFQHIDPTVFLDVAVTSPAYVDRYSQHLEQG